MSTSVTTPVTPAVLSWARRSASVTLEEAAKAAGVSVERLQAWEAGDGLPTLPMLRKLAAKYKRPLAVMLLREPPQGFQALRDFRRVDPSETPMPTSVALEIRTAHERRELALDMAAEADEEPTAFTLRAKLGEDPEEVGQRFRAYFETKFEEQTQWARRGKVFEGWRAKIEAKGILVFVMGGPHGPLVRQVRGFAIPAESFPVIAVNGRDRTNGRTFTLLHECVHLALEQGVVENHIASYRRLPAADRAVEKFCNAVAAATLMPKGALAKEAVRLNKSRFSEWTDAEMTAVADSMGVSREAMLLRAVGLGFAAPRFYAGKRAKFEEEYDKLDEPSGKSVPIAPYKTMLNRYGRTFARIVLDSYHDRRITMNDAAAFLNVQAKHIDYIARQAMN
jgi:Zn-dependent peptidase ImmA (M78 family)/DNA-binding XRE family transcriptional regulator